MLRGKVQSLEGEVEILTGQLNELLQRLNSNGEATAANVDASAVKEIITLKKKVNGISEASFLESISFENTFLVVRVFVGKGDSYLGGVGALWLLR